MERENLSTNRKALGLNLDEKIYGSFAEIGGGQEVSRHFFQVGGASGTVARTISAYDKSFSDAMYSPKKPGRYVSEQRLQKMLNTEFAEVTKLLEKKCSHDTRFFAFADTLETLNYRKTNQGHGWLGLKFLLEPGSGPNQVIVHVNLLENDPVLQQQSIGVLGVNLIFACFNYYEYPNQFLQSLLDNLATDRIEITMVRMSGPELSYVDNRLLAVQLVKNGMTNAVMFDREGNVQQPTDMLYKKNVLAFRGSFRPITYVGFDMLKTSYSIFKRDENYSKRNTLAMCEMTLNSLMETGDLDERDFLDRVDVLNGMGQNVMVSNFREYYMLVSYFNQLKINRLRIVIGIPTFIDVMDKKYYKHMKGGLLEALGKLFVKNMKLYVYPAYGAVSLEDHKTGVNLITTQNLQLEDDVNDVFNYLCKNRKIIDIKNVKKGWLYINSRNVLKMIKHNKPGWEEMVPKYIEEQIKSKKLFGYPGEHENNPDIQASISF
jgi:hypothetical protein